MAGKAYLVVRASVTDPADIGAFDRWYATEHLPDAMKAFGVKRAWRAWSRVEPNVHCAYYEFDDIAHARAGTAPERLGALIAEFDRVWQDRVVRSRDIQETVDERQI
jgi:hypothetical protein